MEIHSSTPTATTPHTVTRNGSRTHSLASTREREKKALKKASSQQIDRERSQAESSELTSPKLQILPLLSPTRTPTQLHRIRHAATMAATTTIPARPLLAAVLAALLLSAASAADSKSTVSLTFSL